MKFHARGQLNESPHLRRSSLLTLVAVLSLGVVACGLTRPTAGEIVGLTRLPTLTRTPLPELTPTPVSKPVAVVIAAEAGAAAPEAASTGSSATLTTQTPAPADASGASAVAGSIEASEVNPAQTSAIDSAAGFTEDTPTPAPTATTTATAIPIRTPTATATATPIPADTPTATPTATPLPDGWHFNGLRLDPDQYENSLLLYGNVINNTGAAQEILSITATFYDAQGQLIAAADDTYASWPSFVIPQGEKIPFELVVDDLDNAANFDLSIEAEPSSDIVRHDFQFSDINQWTADDRYCVAGQLQNPGGQVDDYLIIAAVLYNSRDKVVNYGNQQQFGRIGLETGETAPFDICVEPVKQDIAHYELLAWGE